MEVIFKEEMGELLCVNIKIKECSDVLRTMIVLPLCQILCNKVSYSYSKMLANGKKTLFLSRCL